MSGAPAMTLGEVGRIIVEVRDEQRTFRAEVGEKFGSLDGTYIRAEVFTLTTKALEEKVSKLEANQAWLVRIIVSSVVLAVLAGLFAAGSSFGAFA